MSNEQTKPTTPKKSDAKLADIFKSRREELGLELVAAEKATKIRGRYLRLIEDGDYDKLNDDVYSKGYVKNYAEFLGLDSKSILKLYREERDMFANLRKRPRPEGAKPSLGLKPIDEQGFTVTPRIFLVLFGFGLVALIAGYIIWQVVLLSSPPRLNVDPINERVDTAFVFVSGRVDGGADVYINDSPINSTSDGAFREKVALVDGVNQIKISARNKLGKENVIQKTIIASLPTPSPTPSNMPTSAQKIDGVQLVVRIQKSATFLVVEADGQESFRGTVLPGNDQTFKAKSTIKLTTGNAGNTQLILTNSIVVNKDLGLVGRDGEAKNDLIFSKDTNVQ
ncbi:DUF4115 domain-containing protein [bacterium]|nr:DUF4115 domain-containing protein [bacterium]